MVILPVFEYIIEIDIMGSWHNFYIDSLACGVRAMIVGKAKWKPLELPVSFLGLL